MRILLVEDDELFRLGLSTRLEQESSIEQVSEAEDGETALDRLQADVFDLVILDIGLPGIGGVEACRQIKKRYPKLPVLALTSHAQPRLISRLVEAGAQGYCLKGVDADSLILAIRSVVAGASWWDALATQEIRDAFQGSPSPQLDLDNPLTPRELEILSLVAAGKSNPEIAQLLFIAPGTVRVHVHAILRKLDARDRTQAAVLALQKGLITQ